MKLIVPLFQMNILWNHLPIKWFWYTISPKCSINICLVFSFPMCNEQWFSIRIIFPYFYIDVIFVNVNLPHSRALSLSIASVYALCMFSFCSSNFHSHPMNSLYLQLIQFVHLCTKRLWFYSLIANVCLLYNLMRIHSTILNNNGVCLIIRHITIISSHFWLHDTKLVIMPIFHKAHHTAHVLMCILHNFCRNQPRLINTTLRDSFASVHHDQFSQKIT